MGLPPALLYPMVRLSGMLFGGFDIESINSIDAVKKCTVPVFFAHGESDDYVPCEMSIQNHAACCGPKELLTVPGAGHGLSYVVAPTEYVQTLQQIEQKYKTL